MKTYAIYALCLMLALALPACNGGEKSSSAGGDRMTTLTLASLGDANRLEPMFASDTASSGVSGMIFNGLTKYDKDLKLVGDLAESWDVSEDGLVITFHLRKGVKWQDGEPFTSADVVYTYNLVRDPKAGSPYSDNYGPVEDIAAPDDYTVRVKYKEPFVPALASWGMGIVPRHLNAGYSEAFSRKPVGTGPYRFKEWKSGNMIVVTANEDYFKGPPHIARIVTRVIPDMSTQFLELKAGGIDYMGLNPVQYSKQTSGADFNRKFQKLRYPDFVYTYMGFNLRDGRFKDVRVRKAISHAINKDSIIQGVLLGLGHVCTGPFPPKSWAYNPDVKPYSYDPALAKKMLAEAGWTDTDGDGILDKDGEPFAFTIITNQGNDQRKKCGEIIQQNLKDVGIDVKLKVLEWQSFLNEFVHEGKFAAVILGWALTPDPDPFDIWDSSKTKPGDLNFIGYSNPEVDKLLAEGRRTFDFEKRKAIYRKLHEVIADDAPYVFLYVPDALPAIDRRIKGIKVEPAGIWYNYEDWYIPKDRAEWYK